MLCVYAASMSMSNVGGTHTMHLVVLSLCWICTAFALYHVVSAVGCCVGFVCCYQWCGLLAVFCAFVCAAGVSTSNAGAGHITNYAQNENGDVWDLKQLATHMGQSAWQVGVGKFAGAGAVDQPEAVSSRSAYLHGHCTSHDLTA